MGSVDTVERAVGAVAEDRIFHYHGAFVAAHVPLVIEGMGDGERVALAVAGLEIVDLLGKLVERVAARRRAADQHFEHRLADAGEGHADFRFVVRRIGKADRVADGAPGPGADTRRKKRAEAWRKKGLKESSWQ